MFIGEYEHNLDTKGRMAIPAKFRTGLSGGAIVTRGLDHCLFIFTRAAWEQLAEKLVALPVSQANARAFSRLMLAGAAEADIDQQGRVLIPENLRAYAGLKKEVIVAGLYSKIEVWDAAAWQQYKAKTELASDDIAEKMGELGI